MTNYSEIRNSKSPSPSPSPSKGEGWGGDRGYTLIEMIVVIVILSIASAITIKFLVDSLRVYTMTVNQKTLYDEGKLALEQMCRGIRDANSITGVTASSITFVRDNATANDAVGETISYQLNAGVVQKVKAGNGYAMARNATTFAVTNAINEILLQLTLQLASGENVTLQTSVHAKNLVKDLTYKNFYSNWMEAYQ